MPPPPSSTSEIIHLFGFECFLAANCLKISEEIVTVGLNKTCPISTVILEFLFIFSDSSTDPEEKPLLPLSSYPNLLLMSSTWPNFRKGLWLHPMKYL